MAAPLGTGAFTEEAGRDKQVGGPPGEEEGDVRRVGCTSLFPVLSGDWLFLMSVWRTPGVDWLRWLGVGGTSCLGQWRRGVGGEG